MNLGSVLSKDEKVITAAGVVDSKESFFQDHFPDFPVLPGVLILEIFKRTAEQFLSEPKAAFVLREIRNVKFSSYLKPGDSWEARLEQVSWDGNVSEWKAKLFSAGKPACTAQFKLQKS